MLEQTYSQSFQVQQIVDQKDIDGQPHYLVKWIGYGHQENTWEPGRHMTHSKDKIKDWENYKLKQMKFIESQKDLSSLDLGPLNRRPQKLNSHRVSNPYKSLLPQSISLQIENTSRELQNLTPRLTSFFDRPEIKKMAKKTKAEKKQKQFQMFEKRLKSKPKVWDQYLVNQEEMIRKANLKIKEIVDQVYGSASIPNQKKIQEIQVKSMQKRPINLQESSERLVNIKKIKRRNLIIDSSSSQGQQSENGSKKQKIQQTQTNIKPIICENYTNTTQKNMNLTQLQDEQTNFRKRPKRIHIIKDNTILEQNAKTKVNEDVNNQENKKKMKLHESVRKTFPATNILIEPQTIKLTNEDFFLQNNQQPYIQSKHSISINNISCQLIKCSISEIQHKQSHILCIPQSQHHNTQNIRNKFNVCTQSFQQLIEKLEDQSNDDLDQAFQGPIQVESKSDDQCIKEDQEAQSEQNDQIKTEETQETSSLEEQLSHNSTTSSVEKVNKQSQQYQIRYDSFCT